MLSLMRTAGVSKNYEMVFINITGIGIESLRYRHAVVDNQEFAQLLQMDGPSREVLMRGSEISYFFEQGLEPFTILGDRIVDGLPAIALANFDRLDDYYNFTLLGRTRIANRTCKTIRISAKDGLRYSYVVWLDEITNLPLQIELLGHNGETLEQFRVLSLIVGDEVRTSMLGLATLKLPPLLEIPKSENMELEWSASWLPQGFEQITQGRKMLPAIQTQVESRLYSDGLFSFTISIMPAERNNASQYLHQGRRTIHSEVRNGHEIFIVGELPLTTAKRIADSITFETK